MDEAEKIVSTTDRARVIARIFRRRLGLAFTILSDADLSVTDSFGLRHVGGRGSTGQDMPFPTTFLVSSDGTVLAKFENETYQDRPSPKDVVKAVRRLLAQP